MTQFKHLLAATDLSAPARHAAERAARVAKDIGATLDLVHVAPVSPLQHLRRLAVALPPELPQQLLDEADAALQVLAAALQQQHGVGAGMHVAAGPLLDEIARVVAATSASLVVLGARGSSFIRHLLLGSTAERLVSKATRPMLVVKRSPDASYRNVLVPVDFSAASLPALQCARAVAPNARLVVLHAYDAPFEGKLRQAGVDDKALKHYVLAAEQDARHQMLELCRQAGLPQVQTLVLHGNALSHIFEQELEQDCDLIVVGKHGENRVEELLLGSVTRRVLAESECDVLVSV